MKATSRMLDVGEIRKDFPALRSRVNGKPLIYLDSAGTSQKPRVMIKTLCDVYESRHAKEGELHTLSLAVTQEMEAARDTLARFIHAKEAREIVFLRGATEALNTVARGFANGFLRKGDNVVITAMEHYSNLIPWQMACEQTGAKLQVAPVTPVGELDLERLEKLLSGRTRLVAVAHVANAIGTINPVGQIMRMARERDIPVLVDGAQALPNMPVDVQEIDCDFYTGSGHKIGGPSGSGFLYGKAAWLEQLPATMGGQTMAQTVTLEGWEPRPIPRKFEAGEPEFAESIALGAAARYWLDVGLSDIAAYGAELLQQATEGLRDFPGVRILGTSKMKVPILAFVIEGMDPSLVEESLDQEYGIAVRSGDLSAQPLLTELGVQGAVRASFAFYNTRREVDRFVEAVGCLAERATARQAKRAA
jgi:cysteine desulfurase / selenocysteine lyase